MSSFDSKILLPVFFISTPSLSSASPSQLKNEPPFFFLILRTLCFSNPWILFQDLPWNFVWPTLLALQGHHRNFSSPNFVQNICLVSPFLISKMSPGYASFMGFLKISSLFERADTFLCIYQFNLSANLDFNLGGIFWIGPYSKI